MLNAKALQWRQAPPLSLPKLADLEQLARSSLDEVKRRAPEILEKGRPLARQAQTLATHLTATLVQKVTGHLSRPTVSTTAPVSVVPAQPTETTRRRVRPSGFKLSLKMALQLLLLAVAERTQPSSAPAPQAKPTSPWLISRKDDLIYLIGSSVVSYVFMALLFIFKVKPATVYWLYILFFDGPHIFGTFSRTYADPDEWKKRRNLLLGSLLWFLPGPLAVRFGKGDYFDVFAYMWAYYHLVKQHYGFSILYKKKNNDLAKIDNYLDKALIWTGFTLPYVQFMFSPNYPTGYLRVSDILPAWTPKLAAAAFLSTLAAYLGRQVYKLATHQPINPPKQLLLASSITMHMVTFQLPFARLGGGIYSLASIVAILTTYHNVQYNRLIWFHNQNKYVKDAKEGKTHGLATFFSQNGRRFALIAFLFGAGYRIPLGKLSAGRWGVSQKTGRYIGAAGWGFAFAHYYLDSKIWRVRHDAKLTKALQVTK